jgi:integrase
MIGSPWIVDPVRILTRRELGAVLRSFDARKSKFTNNMRMNLAIFRLACCCGLRVSEIAGVKIGDVRSEGGRPHLRVRSEHAKGGKGRIVPLWWDAGTLADLAEWTRTRIEQGAGQADPLICCLRPDRFGEALARHTIRERFRTACKPLGLARLRSLTIHHGRHTFVSHALARGRTLAEVRLAAGHASLITTTAYLHIAVEEGETPGRLFGYDSSD